MDDAPDELVAYARDIAPEIDRLAIAVHRQARPAAPPLLHEFGLTSAGILVDARALLLAGAITLDDLAQVARVAPRDELAAALEEHVRQDLLERDEASEVFLYACTTRGRDLLLRLTALQGEAITTLWAAHEASLGVLASLATRVSDHAAATLPLDRYPAFRGQHAAPAPLGATPAHLLLTRLTMLRYLRADAHAAAWQAQGLGAAQAGALTALWRASGALSAVDLNGPGNDRAMATLAALRKRGLVAEEAGGWRITEAGRTLRDTIEAATNQAAAPPFTILEEQERAAFLTGLRGLPS